MVTHHLFSAGPCWSVIPSLLWAASPRLLGSLPDPLTSLPAHSSLPSRAHGLLHRLGVQSLGQVHIPALLLPLYDPEHLSCPLSLGSQSHKIGDGNRTCV